MARKLRAKAPKDVTPGKPKIIVFGAPAVGKTWVALEWPRCYFIDVEGGASRPHYQRRLEKSGGYYLGKDQGSQDFRTVIEEVITLASIKHDYLTLVIDSFSKLYNTFAAEAEAKGGSDFGRDKKEANKPTRQLLLWLESLDMNVVLVCHQRSNWKRDGKELISDGYTFDAWEKLEYDLDLVLHVTGTAPSTARVTKTRVEGFPRGSSFPWNYEEFARRAGTQVMTRAPETFDPATAEQVTEISRLVSVLKVEPDWVERVHARAGVTEWSEMPRSAIAACIEHLKGTLTQERTVRDD